ncbi:MAG: endolytic transglycosylase MltG [Ktedonobacteraceae bacterium]|nr:endolytic transglycosylase MltG [Ktedonobacteraceae bacterium]
MRKPRSRAAIISILLLAVIIFGLVYYAWNTATDIFQPVNANAKGSTIPFTITDGETTAQIGDSLQTKGLIRNALAFRIWARVKNLDKFLQAGVYTKLSPGMTISDITDQLLNAQPDATRVIIPEGWRLEQIGQALANANPTLIKFKEDDFLNYTKHIDRFPDKKLYPILQQVPAGQSMEGLLFPSTYDIPVAATARDVIDLLLKTMNDTINQNNLAKLAQMHQMSLYKMLTLASIIERETGAKSDRAKVASVYWNRVYKPNAETNGLLQADPTVQYARDTETPPKPPQKYWSQLQAVGGQVAPNSRWNTYTQAGFPPTPICSPGLASMIAAAAPPVTGDYYFLAKPDGTSVFEQTFAQFQQDVQKYLH